MSVMNQGLQKHTVKKKLRNRGIRPDKIDLEAELDSSLSLSENIKNLEAKYGRLEKESRDFRARQERAQKQRRNQVKEEARRINQERSKYSRYVDATKDAKTTYEDPSERQFNKWQENPNKYDIEGVDTRKPAEQRPQTKLPIQRIQRDTLYTGSEKDLKKSMRKVPGSISRNVNGSREKIAKKKSSQGIEERKKEYERISANQNALISNYDVPDVIEEERKAKRSRSRASKILKDSRNISDLGKNTEEKSYQASLRDGYASKNSEKTLDKWEDNYL